MITIQPVSPCDRAVQGLIAELDAYLTALYPPESNHLDPIEELNKQHVYLVGAFENNCIRGCGAVKVMPENYGEIKRVYVSPQVRGKGIGTRIMNALETFLVRSNIPVARLETGIYQPESLALYKKCGYQQIAPFGDYCEDPLSIFMEKRLLI